MFTLFGRLGTKCPIELPLARISRCRNRVSKFALDRRRDSPLNKRTFPSSEATESIEPVVFHCRPVISLVGAKYHETASQRTSTFPTVTSPFPHSPTTSALHPFSFARSSPPVSSCPAVTAGGGKTFQTLTVPSRCPLDSKWYDRPQAAAQEREVIACAPSPWAAVETLGVPVLEIEGLLDVDEGG